MIGAALPLAKYIRLKRVNIYDAVFALLSKWTVVMLLTFALLLSVKQYFGEPIHCLTDLKFPDFVHSYCWSTGIFLVPSAILDTRNTIAMGVGSDPNNIIRFANDWVSLRYYQWVVIVLLLEAVLFYLPAYLWKRWEAGRLEQLCSPVVDVLTPMEKRVTHCRLLVNYFNADNRLEHGNYVLKYLTCDLLNLIFSGSNIVFLEYFFNGFWTRYIKATSTLPLKNWYMWNEKVSEIFPILAKCQIYTFGVGGSMNKYDNLCVLPLNIMNEKVFCFLGIWYMFMFLLGFLKMVYHLCILTSSSLRAHLLRLRARSVPYCRIRAILKDRTLGDWFVLFKISMNVDPLFLRDLLKELHNCLYYKNADII